MQSCNHYKNLGELFAEAIDIIVTDGRQLELYALIVSIETYEKLNLIEDDQLCMDCDACLTYLENRQLVRGFLEKKGDSTWVRQQKHLVNIFRASDEVSRHNHSFELHSSDFVRSPYTQKHKLLVYLDQNVLDKYHKIEHIEINKRISPGYAEIQYVYSPSHLEEINRMNDHIQEQHVLNTIRTVTSSLFISNFNGNELSLAYEDPELGLARVLKNPEIARDVENLRMLQTETREVFYPEHKDNDHTRKLNDTRVAAHPWVISACERFERKEMLDKLGRIKNYSYVSQAIHALIKALDDIGYKTDNEVRTRRSSAHDNEHMKYAAGTHLFVTRDNKFRDRSQFIYEQLGISTRVMHWDDYAEYLDSIKLK